jgi:hypothetical protein
MNAAPYTINRPAKTTTAPRRKATEEQTAAASENKTMKAIFAVTFQTVTEESAETGDYEDQGFIAEGLTLREAIKEASETHDGNSLEIENIEASSTDKNPRWISVYHAPDLHTGVQETRTIHLPATMTPSSKKRLIDLLNK